MDILDLKRGLKIKKKLVRNKNNSSEWHKFPWFKFKQLWTFRSKKIRIKNKIILASDKNSLNLNTCAHFGPKIRINRWSTLGWVRVWVRVEKGSWKGWGRSLLTKNTSLSGWSILGELQTFLNPFSTLFQTLTQPRVLRLSVFEKWAKKPSPRV